MKKQLLALVLIPVLLCLCLPAYAVSGSFCISNPYASVDFASVRQVKTALHSHTTASDGGATLKQTLERYLATGFDAVAITDHGVTDISWADGPKTNFPKAMLKLLGRSRGNMEYLGASGTFENGTAFTYSEAENGDRYLTTSTGRTILQIPYGIENNAVSVNAHVNSWFVPHCNNSVSTYRDAIRAVNAKGGLCVINHPGEYTKARYEIRSEDAYNPKTLSYAYYMEKFTHLLEAYPACIGIDMNSKGDNRTRFDRILWDRLLTRFAPTGRNIFGIASSDAHQLDVNDTGFSVLLMPELTSACAKTALQTGAFFAASHCIGNYDELCEMEASLRRFYGAENKTLQADIESGKLKADEDLGITYSVLDDDGFSTVDSFPCIRSIAVDQNAHTIQIQASDALLVRFCSGGKTLCTTTPGNAVIDLDDYEGALCGYVRAEVFGAGGILYTQPFLTNRPTAKRASNPLFVDLGFFDFLVGEIHKIHRRAVLWRNNLVSAQTQQLHHFCSEVFGSNPPC